MAKSDPVLASDATITAYAVGGTTSSESANAR